MRPILVGIKQCKSMVILWDSPYNSALFRLVIQWPLYDPQKLSGLSPRGAISHQPFSSAGFDAEICCDLSHPSRYDTLFLIHDFFTTPSPHRSKTYSFPKGKRIIGSKCQFSGVVAVSFREGSGKWRSTVVQDPWCWVVTGLLTGSAFLTWLAASWNIQQFLLGNTSSFTVVFPLSREFSGVHALQKNEGAFHPQPA